LGELTRLASELRELERRALAHALAGWSSGEAAGRLGLSRRSLDNALQRAKRKLDGWQERWAA
jgi:DNA-directed RNA polymerase specialized sigma24 family protein